MTVDQLSDWFEKHTTLDGMWCPGVAEALVGSTPHNAVDIECIVSVGHAPCLPDTLSDVARIDIDDLGSV